MAVAVLVLAYKIRDIYRRPHNSLGWLVCLCMLAGAVNLVMLAPAFRTFVDRETGVPNLSTVFSADSNLIVLTMVLILVTYWRGAVQPILFGARWWITIVAAYLVANKVLFAFGDPSVERPTDYILFYARAWHFVLSFPIYITIHMAVVVAVTWTCWRWARVADRPWLRRGLRIIGAGYVLALAADAGAFVAVAGRWVGTNLDQLYLVGTQQLGGAATVVSAVGFILPILGPRIGGPFARLRAYRTLYPLWIELRRAAPHIDTQLTLPRWSLDLRVHRLATEIADARLALRSYFAHDTAGGIATDLSREAGLSSTDLAATVEATRLKAAVESKIRGDEPAEIIRGSLPPDHDVLDTAAEISWLCRVADAYRMSPIVAAAVRASRISAGTPTHADNSGKAHE